VRVFVTGATGWVGSVVVRDLQDHGHQVIGLCRSEDKARALKATGAEVVLATIDALSSLTRAAASADAVLHLAFNHDFSRYAESADEDAAAIKALGEALQGSGKPLIVTSGIPRVMSGAIATENDLPSSSALVGRKSESAVMALADLGLRAATVRLPPSVHGVGEMHGFVPILIRLAREKGVSAYIGEGENRWPAVHVSDAGRLYRLALESGVTETVYHAVAEEAVPFKAIAEVIGRKLGLPVEPRDREHFGWFGAAAADLPASGSHTARVLGWEPIGPDLIADLEEDGYYR